MTKIKTIISYEHVTYIGMIRAQESILRKSVKQRCLYIVYKVFYILYILEIYKIFIPCFIL